MHIAVRLVLVALLIGLLVPAGPIPRAFAAIEHLAVSEVVTGGASASDELIEIYNPTASALPLEGLEIVYVTATGTTVTRRAAWDLHALPLGPGQHLLVANELGIYAAIADMTYASGISATGGSVALRVQGAMTAIDAVGWGTAASTWLEGSPIAAPPAGSSIERLPGGDLGSTIDTDDNAADFAVRQVPDPQNRGSAPVPDPGATPGPTLSPDPTEPPQPTTPPQPTSPPTPIPSESILPIATARSLADDSTVAVEADALTDSAFTEGGGYVADATGGIAVMVDGAMFQRGNRVRLRGTLDTRYGQRTLRVAASGLTVVGAGAEPAARHVPTGAVDEDDEALLSVIEGRITGAGTALSGGVAWDVDDGTGPVRVLVGSQTGIDTSGWLRDVAVRVIGLVGQRDSTGTGASGYRVQPRDPGDVALGAGPDPSPAPSGPATSPTPTPTQDPSMAPGVTSIARARAAAKNTKLTVRGVVTLPTGVLNAATAVIQDATGAILLRLGDEVGPLNLGQLVEVAGARSTKGGMESLRVSVPPRVVGSSAQPAAQPVRTGETAERLEARIVVVRGAVVASPRRASSGSVSFEVDDGSGPLRVHVGAGADIPADDLLAGSWIEVTGVFGQETTGAQPLRGYRIWPREPDDVRVTAAAGTVATGSGDDPADAAMDGGGGRAGASLAALGRRDLAEVRVGATLVAGAWPELGVAGLLWDGERLVGIAAASGERLAPVAASRPPPVPVELEGLRRVGRHPDARIDLVELGSAPGQVVLGRAPTAPPLGVIPPKGPPVWVSLVGTLQSTGTGLALTAGEGTLPVERRCSEPAPDPRPGDVVAVTGIGFAAPPRLVVGCGSIVAAPRLALAGSFDRESGSTIPAGATTAAPDPVLEPPIGPALLLVLGAIGLVLAAIGSRRFAALEAPPSAPSGTLDDTAADEPPALTLIRRSREHES